MNLHGSFELFNYCQLNNYNSAGIARLLEYYNISSTEKWVAYAPLFSHRDVVVDCFVRGVSSSWEDVYKLYYGHLMLPKLQAIGNLKIIY